MTMVNRFNRGLISQIILCDAADQANLVVDPGGVCPECRIVRLADGDYPLADSWAVSHRGAGGAGNCGRTWCFRVSCFPQVAPSTHSCMVLLESSSILTRSAAACVAGAARERGGAIGGSAGQVWVGS